MKDKSINSNKLACIFHKYGWIVYILIPPDESSNGGFKALVRKKDVNDVLNTISIISGPLFSKGECRIVEVSLNNSAPIELDYEELDSILRNPVR